MEYREIGRTGLKVSALSLGGSSFGGVFREIDEKLAEETVIAALECGINFIDVSPYYGFTRAERVLGKALKHIPRNRYYLSTKVGRYGVGGEKVFDYSAKRARESLKESMERLNISFIDLINVHDIEFSDLDQVINETLPALVDLRNEGVAGHVGITGLPLELFTKVIDSVPAGTVESILSFCHYTLQDDSLVDYLDYFEGHGVGVINSAPLSMGLLSERGIPAWHPASEKLARTCKQAVDHCISNGYRIEQLALKFSISNPRISTTLVGTANPENITLNCSWAGEAFNEKLFIEVSEILRPVARETWSNS